MPPARRLVFNETKMKTPDINRIKRAIAHIEAAKTVLKSIKWENRSMMEDHLVRCADDYLLHGENSLNDVLNIQEGKPC